MSRLAQRLMSSKLSAHAPRDGGRDHHSPQQAKIQTKLQAPRRTYSFLIKSSVLTKPSFVGLLVSNPSILFGV